MRVSHHDLLLMPWAKHDSKTELVHPLVCHLIDTMEVARLLYHRFLGPGVRKELDQVFGPLTGGDREQTVQWVALLCGLHDLGKYSPAFQSLVVEAAKKRFPESEHALLEGCAGSRPLADLDTKHGLTTGVHFEAMLGELQAEATTKVVLSQVLAGHHGYFPLSGELRGRGDTRAGRHRKDIGNELWQDGRSAMVRELAQLTGLVFDDPAWTEVRLSPRAAIGLAGLTTISDWVASDTTFFPYAKEPECLDEYRSRAATYAEQALDATGWWTWEPGERTGFAEIFGKKPLPLQSVVEQTVEDCADAGVLVIEAPTGEGKTKTGLQAAARLAHRLGLGGLYYSTPTKELSRQAADDVRALLDGTGSELAVNLVYSGAKTEQKQLEEDTRAKARPTIDPSNTGCEDEAGEDGGAFDPREWFFRKKGLAFPVGVGTVDQALKSVIRGGHNFLGMAALSNKVVVIDEVHAYDAYTAQLVDQLMWYCGWWGSPVVLMSATLTADQRSELIEHWHAGAESRLPLPEVSAVIAPTQWNVTWSRDTMSREFELSPVAQKRGALHVEHMDESPEVIAGLVEGLMGQSGTALVVLNTRTRAKAVRDELESRFSGVDHPPELIHFDGDHQGKERRETQARIDAHLGKNSPDERHAVVVGTQVLEHGMDLDADVLVTDLCPIDLLFQRAGRLHRHDRKDRPPHLTSPTLYVADIDPAVRAARTPGNRKSLGFAKGVANVYKPWILGRTRVLLQEVLRQREWNPMDEIGKQIHRVYVSSESLSEEGWQTAWEKAERSHDLYLERAEADARGVLVPLFRDVAGLSRMTRRRAPAGSTRQSKGKERDAETRGR